MIYAIILIIYISILSIYTPRSWLMLINHPYVKFAILLYILYVIVYEEDLVLGIFMVVAFILTITLDNSIQAAKVTYENDIIEANKESFTSKKSDNVDEENEEDFINDEEDEEKYQNMITDKTLKDTFQNLHESIHELQKMMVEKKK